MSDVTPQYISVFRGRKSARIDTDISPARPFTGARIWNHLMGGYASVMYFGDRLYINDREVILCRSNRQANGVWVSGTNLYNELSVMPVLPANFLDFLMNNQEFIPDTWKLVHPTYTLYVFFWGTIYQGVHFDKYVRYLCFRGGVSQSGYRHLDQPWRNNSPAAIRCGDVTVTVKS